MQPSDPTEHHFGPDPESAMIEKLIGKSRIMFYTTCGSPVIITFYVTDDDNPVLLGHNFWDDPSLKPISMPWEDSVSVFINGKREKIPSFADPTIGNLRRVKLLVPKKSEVAMTSIVFSTKSGIDVLNDVHKKTHASFRDIQMLLERTGNWSPVTESELIRLRNECEICRSQSDPKPNTKYGLKLSPDFNFEVGVDITYLDAGLLSISPSHLSEVYSGNQLAILHIMCNRTWYSEVEVITSRSLSKLIETVECVWNLNHGYPQCSKIESPNYRYPLG